MVRLSQISITLWAFLSLTGCADPDQAARWVGETTSPLKGEFTVGSKVNSSNESAAAKRQITAQADEPSSQLAALITPVSRLEARPQPPTIPEQCTEEQMRACCETCQDNEPGDAKGRVCCCTCEDAAGHIHEGVAVACSFIGPRGGGDIESFPGQFAMDQCAYEHELGHIRDGEFYCVDRQHGTHALWDPTADPAQNHERCEGNQYTEEEACLRVYDCSAYGETQDQKACRKYLTQRANWLRENNPDNRDSGRANDRDCVVASSCEGPSTNGSSLDSPR